MLWARLVVPEIWQQLLGELADFPVRAIAGNLHMFQFIPVEFLVKAY